MTIDPESPQSARERAPNLVSDCRLMLRQALREGLELPTALQSDLSELDRSLSRCGLPTLSHLPGCLFGDKAPGLQPVAVQTADTAALDSCTSLGGVTTANAAPPGDSGIGVPRDQAGSDAATMPANDVLLLLYGVHGALVRVVSPATVASLLATEPRAGHERSFFASTPQVIRLAAGLAALCAVGYVLTAIPTVERTGDSRPHLTSPASGAPTGANSSTGK